MRLKRLDMTGFKSFMDRTVIEFDKPITAIVGPNGCGKSNVVDAIRWVMGEQSPKHLRGQSMEDVIFNGSEKRPALSMANVELTLSVEAGGFPAPYHDFTEVAICRRLYRDGTSDYLINRHSMRLRDILDFFAGTGLGKTHYSVVEQGRVNELIMAKPDERRTFIEEAAGVSRFKARKEAALRKMEACHMNLLRLGDLLQELERQMRSLDRQVAKARRYQELHAELKEKDLTLAAARYKRLSEHVNAIEARHQGLKAEVETLDIQINQREADLAAHHLRQSEEETALADLQEKDYQYQNSLNLLETSYRFKGDEKEERTGSSRTLNDEIELLHKRLEEANVRLHTWQQGEGNLGTKAEEIHRDYENALLRLGERKQNESIAAAEFATLKEGQFRLHSQLDGLSEREQHLLERQDKIDDKITAITARLESSASHLNEAELLVTQDQQALENARQLRLTLIQNRDALAETISSQKQELTEFEDKVAAIHHDLTKKHSRLESLEGLEKSFEGYGEGVRFVMGEGKSDGILGTVAQILETDSEYEIALAAALADKLEYVLCNDHHSGKSILAALKQAAKGRAALVPITLAVPAASSPIHGSGVLGPLRHFVRVKHEKYSVIADTLLVDMVIVDDLSTALSLFNDHPNRRLTFVTLDGDILTPSGIMIAGKGDSGIETILQNRREQKELRARIADIEREHHLQDEIKKRLAARIQKMERELETLKESQHEEELHLVEIENRLLSTQKAQDQGKAIRAELERDRRALEEERAEVTTLFNDLSGRRNAISAQISAAETALHAATESVQAAKTHLEESQEEVAHLKAKMATIDEENARFKAEGLRLANEAEETGASLERRRRDLAFHEERLSQLDAERTSIEEQLQALRAAHAEMKHSLERTKASCQGNQEAVRAQEIALHSLRKTRDEQSKTLHTLSLELQEVAMQCEHAFTHCMEEYQVDLREWLATTAVPALAHYEEEAITHAVTELRDKLSHLGPVNIDAISEFEEIKNRHDFLSTQKVDLEHSLTSLQKAVTKIDETSKKRMIDAFTFINHAFQMQFPKLFRGGRAHLALTNEEDILSSGVEVFAQPPGKKLQLISLLSGGEKALTALSLLFAILNYRPSPFCILDEVDAPLDDQNVHRYNELIRTMTDRTQFLLITHAKLTMEIADTLYGVTMPEAGVSKIVTVDLEARETAEAAA